MNKFLSFSGIFVLLLTVFSCSTPDPDAVYEEVQPIVSNGNIAGPRIIVRVDSSNVELAKYTSTNAGVLQKVNYANGKSETVEFGLNGKVQKIEFNAGATNRSTLVLVYNSVGRLTNAVQEEFVNYYLQNIFEIGLSYNADGKLSFVEKKQKNPTTNQFIAYTRFSLTYNGENIVHLTSNSAGMNGNTYLPLSPANAVHFIFENYDTKVNPLSTLSKEFLTGIALVSPFKFGGLSANNYLKVSKQIGSTGTPAVISQYSGFKYDAQDFLMSSSNGVMKVYYKNKL